MSWLHTKRKIHCNAITEENAKILYNYSSQIASRPKGDKKDTLKQRIGKNECIRHARQVLEKTQTGAYMEFCTLHPEIKIKQSKFEGFKRKHLFVN